MIRCIKCSAPVDTGEMNTHQFEICSGCGAQARVDVYPAALNTGPKQDSNELAIADDEAGCFYHPQKKAVVHCSSCGRFLCSLCDVEMDGAHICFTCMESGKKKNTLKNLENNRTLYDSITIRVACIPLTGILWFMVFFTAPIALFMVFWFWNAPSSIIPRTKIRMVFAFILSVIQIAGCSVLIYNLVA